MSGDTGMLVPEKDQEIKLSPENLLKTDRADFSSFPDQMSGIRQQDAVKKLLSDLASGYPDIHISVIAGKTAEDVKGMAASLGRGKHLVISEEFLKRMYSSTEEYQKCGSMLEEIVGKLAGQASGGVFIGEKEAVFWAIGSGNNDQSGNLVQTNRGIQGRLSTGLSGGTAKGQETGNKIKVTVPNNFSVSRYYAKMAGAKSQGQVRTVMSEAQRSIVNMHMAAALGEKEERLKAQRAIRSLYKLMARGGRKIGRLNREELLTAREKRAAREREEKARLQTAIELKKERKARIRADYALLKEGKADDASIRNCKLYRKARDAYLENRISWSAALPSDMAGSDMGGEIAAADVAVMETVAF